VTGTIYTGWWQRTQEQMQQQAGSALSTDCNQERILSGRLPWNLCYCYAAAPFRRHAMYTVGITGRAKI